MALEASSFCRFVLMGSMFLVLDVLALLSQLIAEDIPLGSQLFNFDV